MAKALTILVEGFEEIEAVTIIDVLRRAGVEVVIAGLAAGPVPGSHEIVVSAEVALDAARVQDFDALVLPGGMPGAATLRDEPRVQRVVREFSEQGKLVAAICAAPIALEAAGVLRGKQATSYPGNPLPSARYSEESVVEDGPVITSRAAGTAFAFALRLVERLVSKDEAERQRAKLLLS
ncbi:MAG TPA: DJ-1 family glyoxalase III [Polyangiaceae bacterium]